MNQWVDRGSSMGILRRGLEKHGEIGERFQEETVLFIRPRWPCSLAALLVPVLKKRGKNRGKDEVIYQFGHVVSEGAEFFV